MSIVASKHTLRSVLAASLVLGMVLAYGCSSSDPAPAANTQSCVPGASKACAGPQACNGFQACAADGKSFDPCVCGAGGAGGAAGSSSTGGNGGQSTGGGGQSTGGGGQSTGGGGQSTGGGGQSAGGGGQSAGGGGQSAGGGGQNAAGGGQNAGGGGQPGGSGGSGGNPPSCVLEKCDAACATTGKVGTCLSDQCVCAYPTQTCNYQDAFDAGFPTNCGNNQCAICCATTALPCGVCTDITTCTCSPAQACGM
jgi:hypothetical protein